MTDEDAPELVAAANLSPVSPRPMHNTYTLPQVLPELQDRAEDPNAVPFEPTTFRTAAAAMATEPDILDEIVVEGSSEDSDDESFDYDDDDNGGKSQGQESTTQELRQEVAEPEENDDYARTFDSPTEKEEQTEIENDDGQGQQSPQHVTDAPESMTISDQPDAVPPVTQSPAQPPTLDPSIANNITQSSQADQPANSAPAVSVPDPVESGQEPSPAVQESHPDTAAQQSVSAPQSETGKEDAVHPDDASFKKEDSDVQPKSEDVEMTTESVADATSLDIQKLVDEITAEAEDTTSEPPASDATPASAQAAPSAADVDMSSLPPKPALTQEQSKQTYSPASFHHASLPNAPNFPTSTGLPAHSPYANAGTPSNSQPQTFNNTTSFASHSNVYPPGTAPSTTGFPAQGLQQTYDEFLADERRHMAEAKWERFPEGSRIFIGNLSQERVSKRDVFELFHGYGRLAQISLKSAYGFVQYHTTNDAQAAMNALQGAEVKGRKINLEVSKTQKTKKDRDHSPDRRNRNDRASRNNDRYEGRDGRRGRDDYRQGRSPSPRREDHRARQDSYGGRDWGHYDGSNRKRSRSPEPYRRQGQDSYRRRSPSPYGRGHQESDHLDIPRRYGGDVPDVQILLLQDVHKDFVDWVQRAFWDCKLKTNVMFLNPRFPRDAVIQRQVLEGVHGVVELDMRAQNTAKISLQVFDRSAGSNVRFDQYQDLDPPIAGQLVLRTKGAIAPPPAYPPQPAYQTQPYGAPADYPAYPQPPAPVQQPPAANPDITGLVGQLSQMPNVDGATLQTILASLQQPGAPHAPPAGYPTHYGGHQAPHPNPQMDLNALISNLSAASANTGQPTIGAPMPGYPAPPYQQGNRGPPPPLPQAGSADPNRDVENIMATLARIRQ